MYFRAIYGFVKMKIDSRINKTSLKMRIEVAMVFVGLQYKNGSHDIVIFEIDVQYFTTDRCKRYLRKYIYQKVHLHSDTTSSS